MNSAGPQPFLRDEKPIPRLSECIRHGYPAVAVIDFAVRAGRLAHYGDRPDDLESRRVRGHDNLAHPAVRVAIWVADAHDYRERGADRAAREPLVAINDPFVAVAHRACLEPGRVCARDLWFGHGEAGPDITVDKRP